MPTESLGPRVRGYLAPLLADQVAWSALLDAPIPTAAATADGRVVLINQAMLELVQYPLDKVLGTAWLQAMFPDPGGEANVRNLIAEILTSPVTTRHRLEVLCGDGRRRILELTSTGV